MCIADINTSTFLKVNPSFTRILGFSEQELLSRSFLDFVHPEDIQATADVVEKELRKGKKILRFENRYRTLDGDYRWLDWTSHPVPEKGITYAIAHDVTERKKANETLRDSENKLRSIFRAAPVGIGMVSDRVLLEVNPRICEMTGYRTDELVGKSARVFYPSREEFDYVGKEKYRQIAEFGTGSVETRWQRKDGKVIDVLLSSTPIDVRDLSRGVTFSALEITGRKRNEERIQNLLKEKDMLLREVHHRIKNNMIIMKSLLSLQAEKVQDSSARTALENAKNRMTSMMVLYDRIYRNEPADEIPIDDYLSNLIDEIVKTYPKDILIEKTLDKVLIPVTIASTLGIIINELISNAIKYAFPDEDNRNLNKIRISVSGIDDWVEVVIHDNGRGFEFEKQPKGFGFDLVESLVAQLEGNFRIEQENGTRCIMKFNLSAAR